MASQYFCHLSSACYNFHRVVIFRYGTVDFSDDIGCYSIGLYAIICHVVVYLLIIPKLVAAWTVNADYCETIHSSAMDFQRRPSSNRSMMNGRKLYNL